MIVRSVPLISFIAAPRVLGSKEATTLVTRGADHHMEVKSFSEIKKSLSKPLGGCRTIVRVAVLGDSATQFLSLALRGLGLDRGFDLNILEADFDQIELQVFDSASELYGFKPEIVRGSSIM